MAVLSLLQGRGWKFRATVERASKNDLKEVSSGDCPVTGLKSSATDNREPNSGAQTTACLPIRRNSTAGNPELLRQLCCKQSSNTIKF